MPWAAPAYSGAVALSGYATARLAPERRERVLRAHSTNVDNLRAGRWYTLVTSAFFVEEPLGPGFGAVLPLALGRAEAAWGVRRTAAVFALGHVGASLLVYAGLRAAGVSGRTARAVDVGPSYGFNAVLAARAASVPHPAARAAATAGLLALGVRPLLRRGRTFTDAGHLAALVLGAGAATLRRRHRSHGHAQ
ncbi:hypothetical protein SCATT_13220 [Streptantibioticus cattleyicolor NRRL 8057 = DSM 46488]|uniref:Peptidase S54 rhomboid domain-containing protein n=1 Tax=Streptantibioticus cattleyicolor (strain ATCC 35852 / DSM 46488 / JCM 4925 / NBRC 14057 / NRRL 8057) TaxID=1003195 RepID=F8K205_STREN|nr:hypothetical protein SCATT_13220 [Streptantibioticus cattleyicolor NRRL 8057 = DSM 46488]MYS58392.1 hypothetical protein [Streptomyces sp. SID5468]CCB74047.1 protein of unknown function [Streptantibioticus cattleyicolor NRRL 8057 = DSM 46488]